MGVGHFIKNAFNKTLESTTGFKLVRSKRNNNSTFSSRYTFENRSTNAENLLLMLVGFQPYYWDVLFSKVQVAATSFNEKLDVCVCIPCGCDGAFDIIRQKVADYGWSILYIAEDRLAQVQNTAIKLHPCAQWIFKIDEDIIVPSFYFSSLKESYIRVNDESLHRLGLMTPLINLNAVGLPVFLKTMGLLDEYQNRFGQLKSRFPEGLEDKIHTNVDVARFVWNRSVPFDQTAEIIADKNRGNYSFASIRLSIGAILFTREFWNRIGFFQVGDLGAMGVEERQVNAYCMVNMYAIAIAEDVFAGHLGFFSQKEACKDFFENNINLF